ncbi:hypothetical protein Gotur_004018, partial [Gossypium turneri]
MKGICKLHQVCKHPTVTVEGKRLKSRNMELRP